MKILDLDIVPAHYEEEIMEAAARARRVGARGTLRLVGMGMTGVVLCDERHHGFKRVPVSSGHNDAAEDVLQPSDNDKKIASCGLGLCHSRPACLRYSASRSMIQ